jgi:hypothetical protein
MALPPGVKVATDALRTEAGVWDQQSAQMGTVATTVDGLRFNRSRRASSSSSSARTATWSNRSTAAARRPYRG